MEQEIKQKQIMKNILIGVGLFFTLTFLIIPSCFTASILDLLIFVIFIPCIHFVGTTGTNPASLVKTYIT